MIEAQACGCPVIAFHRGSVPEVVRDKKTGFIVKKDVLEMTRALKDIELINRKECRRHVERNFTIERMVDKYEKAYYKIVR
jgi:glycosyltransferase involved in cell wall biosynthesis